MNREELQPLSVRSWPQSIVHVDGDSFFASCEQVMHPEYSGKPVVVGAERGIATAMSKEAKEAGITRGMQTHEIKKRCPDCIIVPSDYETYSLFSARMFDIVRRYTPTVEEYSIDECFADITGLRQSARGSYEDIARAIKNDLERDLGITFSVGVAPSKVVAKVATGWDKPDGFTSIPAKHIHRYLKALPIGDVWGIGSNTAHFLKKRGVTTALSFAQMSEEWVEETLAKPYQEVWHELRGRSIKEVETKKSDPKSISKTKTFTPPSSDREYVRSQLSKNIENACIKLRRYDMYADTVSIFLKHADFTTCGRKITLSQHTNAPNQILSVLKDVFDALFDANSRYRATGVRLSNLVYEEAQQQDLFDNHVEIQKLSNIFETVDEVDDTYGKHTIYLGASAKALKHGNYQGKRGKKPTRQKNILDGEGNRRHIGIPYLGTVK